MANTFLEALKNRILVLDGAMGTMIQNYRFSESDFRGREFINHPQSLSGFNDILNITKPSSIKAIHSEYLKAGADIITTNTFNSNRISIKDYGLERSDGIIKRLNKEGVRLVKEAIDEYEIKNNSKKHFVGGSIGPTSRSASMSPDISDPLERNISYDELFDAYSEQIEGLLEGGADILIFETFFDTLNLKAGLGAAESIMKKRGENKPIIVSATVSDNAGRILSGQTLEAFVASIEDFDNVSVIGINCGFGPERMINYIDRINLINSHFTSCHPNAGLPDENGYYNVSPKEFGEKIKPLLLGGYLNVVGGCCGTTPEHIEVLSYLTKGLTPHCPIKKEKCINLAGLENLKINDGFTVIGERCNVAGSAKFLRLIREGNLEEATNIAKSQIEKGASIIDINMDDPMLNAKKDMVEFLRYILAEPEVAKVPLMIDSSKWEVIEGSLKEIQGKGIVNSLSLKEGEEIFKEKACKVKDLGFALVVMAFDEKGQADTYERKVEVCRRSYDILTKECGFLPENIIFDVNIMTIGTGMKEHARYALDFIETVKWIKINLRGARVSGGVSNLSFAFRGKNKIREYMHIVFLHHARNAGLDMAIISPAQKTRYEDIPVEIKDVIEDIIFDRDDNAVEKLIEIAGREELKEKKEDKNIISPDAAKNISEILEEDLKKGELTNLEEHLGKAMEEIKDPIKIIEGPLLQGMKKVGDLFGEGKMFLPQVIKTARTMKRAVELLTPEIERARIGSQGKKNGKILVATVKGDVHDIGKNIVSTVLACNNYEIIDLGIMVPPEKIVEVAGKEKPDIICLSGLITPSLGEMIETVRQLHEANINIPVMVGGAATSLLHTALKIDPAYGEGNVIHMRDASQNPIVANALLTLGKREDYIKRLTTKYNELRNKEDLKNSIIPFKEVLSIVAGKKRNPEFTEKPRAELGKPIEINIPLNEIIPYVNWKMFFLAWKLQGKYIENFSFESSSEDVEIRIERLDEEDRQKAREAKELYVQANKFLKKFHESGKFDGKALVRFENSHADEKNIYVGGVEFPMLRQQRKDTDFLSMADFIGKENSYIGFFALSSGEYLDKLSKKMESDGDTYNALIVSTLADRLVEAGAEWLQNYVNENLWKVNIRPAWGYPMLPDQTMILSTQKFIPYQTIGITLTENGAMYPPASISGVYISDPESKYFMIGKIGEDQLKDYSKRRGEKMDKALLNLVV